MNDEYKAGVNVTVGPNLISPHNSDHLGKTGVIKCYVGTDRTGNYYKVILDGGAGERSFYTSELTLGLPLTKEEQAAKLRAELAKLDAEIEAEAKEKARNEIKGLAIGTLIECNVDSDEEIFVKVGEDKWHVFSKFGDPLEHHSNCGDKYVITEVQKAKKHGYCKIFPGNED